MLKWAVVFLLIAIVAGGNVPSRVEIRSAGVAV